MTRVKFYIIKGEVLAYFPDIDGENKGNKTCYAHIGQHSACHPDYLKKGRLAHPDEYNDLLNELRGQGYDDLQILDNRTTLTKILCPVNCKYGAPMGRADYGKKPTTGKTYDSPVPLSEGYDKGGAYWGWPNNLRVKYTKDLEYVEFYRNITHCKN